MTAVRRGESWNDVNVPGVRPTDADYTTLLGLRTGLRHFLHWSAQQAKAAGLTPAQHQLMLAIRGHADPLGPTIGEVADYLLLQHHSTVGLVDRAEALGLVRRHRDRDDHRVVRLRLSGSGARRLESLSALTLQELERLQLDIPAAWSGLGPRPQHHGIPGVTEHSAVKVEVARIYDIGRDSRTEKVLVDRLWPRGVARAKAPFDDWMKEVAPSADLRKWYGHVPARFHEFDRRYRRELSHGAAHDALETLRGLARTRPVTLVTATKNLQRSGAAVLADVLAGN